MRHRVSTGLSFRGLVEERKKIILYPLLPHIFLSSFIFRFLWTEALSSTITVSFFYLRREPVKVIHKIVYIDRFLCCKAFILISWVFMSRKLNLAVCLDGMQIFLSWTTTHRVYNHLYLIFINIKVQFYLWNHAFQILELVWVELREWVPLACFLIHLYLALMFLKAL